MTMTMTIETDNVASLERFEAKWRPVRVKKTRQIKNLAPRFDSIETEKAPGEPSVSGRRLLRRGQISRN